MTFTATDSDYSFFVVGGNSSGTDTGRVYLTYIRSIGGYPPTSYYYLFDSGHNATQYLVWTPSSWTSDTMIVLGGAYANVDPTKFGVTDLSALTSVGIGGSVLYDSVVTI